MGQILEARELQEAAQYAHLPFVLTTEKGCLLALASQMEMAPFLARLVFEEARCPLLEMSSLNPPLLHLEM